MFRGMGGVAWLFLSCHHAHTRAPAARTAFTQSSLQSPTARHPAATKVHSVLLPAPEKKQSCDARTPRETTNTPDGRDALLFLPCLPLRRSRMVSMISPYLRAHEAADAEHEVRRASW